MGITADLLNSKSLGPSANRDGLQRVLHRYMDQLVATQGDPAYVNRDAAVDEVQQIEQHVATVSGGTYALTVKVFNGETFTTAGIAFDADLATMEAAIDTAASGVITGWTNGDISVGENALSAGEATFIYDGSSVASQRHFLIVIDGTNLTGGGSEGATSVTTFGQPDRPALGALNLIGATTDTQPIGSLPGSSDYNAAKPGSLALNPPETFLKMLADEAGIECGIVGVGGAAVRDEHLRLMRVQGFAV